MYPEIVVTSIYLSHMEDTPAINIAQVTHDEETRKARTYKMPTFTEDQQQVVFHKDGPMRVCVGPGSGKTASLTGRIHELIRKGVPTEFLLMTRRSVSAWDQT